MSLSFISVTTDQQFRDLLIVRNECRDGLTHDKREISLEEQWKWKKRCWGISEDWTTITSEYVSSWNIEWYEPYLLYDGDWPVGYGLLKWDGEKYWMTVGVAKDYRKKGNGKLIVNLITEMGHRGGSEVWLDVMEDNPMLATYIKAGYEFVDTVRYGANDLHTMKHKREQNYHPRELFWLQNHNQL